MKTDFWSSTRSTGELEEGLNTKNNKVRDCPNSRGVWFCFFLGEFFIRYIFLYDSPFLVKDGLR